LVASKNVLEPKSEIQEILESWGNLLSFLRAQGMMAEITTQYKIKPIPKERKEIIGSSDRRRTLVQNILRKHSHTLSLELRKDFSLGEITEEKIDLSLLDSSLSEYADEEEDSVELVKSTRRRF